ncbi:CaiB/BaiF CoA transferase family protein [Microbacterium sp. NPDC058062]|uniref:CaiB/BaiF CoA transferase family protein n=1 Tax=Microbacterium sp. NPDC058062 TaxID=3346320 RepID=UPI0036DB6619
MGEASRSGPLEGTRVIELMGIGPVPHAGMLLADMGADVLRIDRPAAPTGPRPGDIRGGIVHRGKEHLVLDITTTAGREQILERVESSDVLIEGARPGVAERLGLGPDECSRHNRALVYGRMTGWGQDGPLSGIAGHDINYLALSGILHGSGQSRTPQFTSNLLGDYGAGSMYLVVGVLAALLHARATGVGRVVDAAIVDGGAHLLTNAMWMRSAGLQSDTPGQSVLDGGAPYYQVYETQDGEFVAVGAIEPAFFAQLVSTLGLSFDPASQNDRESWPDLQNRLTRAFLAHPRGHWEKVFAGVDACVTPVLSLPEAQAHPHVQSRKSIVVGRSGELEPGYAPRFSIAGDHDALMAEDGPTAPYPAPAGEEAGGSS